MTKKILACLIPFACAVSIAGSTSVAHAKRGKAKPAAEAKAIQLEEALEEAGGESLGAKLVVDPSSAVSKSSGLAGETLPATSAPALPAAGALPEVGASVAVPGAAVSIGAGVPALNAEPAVDKNKLAENEIPVLATGKDQKKASGSAYGKLAATLGVLALLFAGLSFALKKWLASRGGKTQNTRIKVLTQHHLGPKKSLAIISVAGESLLIGVTDHNISMLKTLSLLDEEIPETTPKRFEQAMNEFDEEADAPGSDEFAVQGLTEIRDKVSTRLKSMRRW